MLSIWYQILTDDSMTRETAVFFVVFFLLSMAALIFVSLPLHEFSHGLAAYLLGDNTAKWNGRLTLNPLKHLDVFGTLMMVLCGFGYAKPVPVNPRNFRNPRVGMALTALAGPLSNLLLVFLSMGLFRILLLVYEICLGIEATYTWLPDYLFVLSILKVCLIDIFARYNIVLAVFNLLPIPPLDGSRIASLILPEKWFFALARYERYLTIGLFILLMSPIMDAPLNLLYEGVTFVICWLFGMPNIM